MRRICCITLLAAAGISGTAVAQTKPADGLWHGAMAAGVSLASGNTRSSAFSLVGDGAVETAADKLTIYGTALNASTKNAAGDKTKTADLYRLGARYDRNITDRLFGFGGLELEKDGIQSLKLRSGVNAGLGYHVLRGDSITFDVFGGVGYVRNDYKVATDTSGATLLLGEESTHKLSATSAFKQRLVIYPGLKSSLGNRATWDATVSTALAGNLTLNATYSLRHASKVPDGVKRTDSLFIVGVGYKF